MTNRTAFNAVVLFLGFGFLLCIGGVITLNAINHPVDDLLKQIATGCLAGLAGLLARSPGDDRPTEVNVVNRPDEPVPVDAGHGELRSVLIFGAGGLLALVLFYLVLLPLLR